MYNLFVYGTLCKGKNNFRFLNDSKFLGYYHTDNNFSLVITGLPFMIRRKGDGVSGQLYRVDDYTLKRIDKLEGHPDFYKREEIYVYDTETGTNVRAYAYIHPDIFPKHIETRRSYE